MPLRSGSASGTFARLVILLRFLLLPALVVAAGASWRYLPGISTLPESGADGLLPSHTSEARAEARAQRLFGSALLPRIAVVQRDPRGLSADAQRRIVLQAVRLDQSELRAFPRGSQALPYLNSSKAVPGARERSTTAITYLGFPSAVPAVVQRNLADRYADAVSVPGARAHATGFLPGSVAQTDAIDRALFWVELATVLGVATVIGVSLRSLLAPLVTLGSAGVAYAIAVGVVSFIGEHQGVAVQREAAPIMVVLLLGIVTDYSVFFLSSMRDRLRSGEQPRQAAVGATAQVLPIVLGAGLLVAAGLATLRLASIGFVQTLGPAMAVVVLVSVVVSIILIPAAMGILGRALFWPGMGATPGAEGWWTRAGAAGRRGVANATSRRWLAAPVALIASGSLALASIGVAHTRLALTPIRGAPAGSPPAMGAEDAARGFAAGLVAPSEIIILAPHIGARQAVLRQLGQVLSREPEIGAAIGAGELPLPPRYRLAFESRDGNAARYFIAFAHHPYSSAGTADLARLQATMPQLLRATHLTSAQVLYAGDTALAQETVHRTVSDLVRVGLAAIAINLIFLAIFLRSIVASLILVASSIAGITATLGLTTYVFQNLLGTPDLTYFVVLAVGVLLLSFGTDYNLFVVARIWQEAKNREPRDAIRAAVPRAGRAISVAGVALALSFATLAIVPIAPFRELGVALGLGIMIDTFVVRTLLIPALLSVFARASWWPSNVERQGVSGKDRERTSIRQSRTP
jgi:putative drug exporter of the RND superfamily